MATLEQTDLLYLCRLKTVRSPAHFRALASYSGEPFEAFEPETGPAFERARPFVLANHLIAMRHSDDLLWREYSAYVRECELGVIRDVNFTPLEEAA